MAKATVESTQKKGTAKALAVTGGFTGVLLLLWLLFRGKGPPPSEPAVTVSLSWD